LWIISIHNSLKPLTPQTFKILDNLEIRLETQLLACTKFEDAAQGSDAKRHFSLLMKERASPVIAVAAKAINETTILVIDTAMDDSVAHKLSCNRNL